MQLNNNRMIPPVSPNLPQAQVQNAPQELGFGQLMEGLRKSQDVQFSKHANMRLNDRNIQLDQGQMRRLEQGVQTAQTKGIRDGLVLIDNIALVVNIKNKMVITAINSQEQVVTNIDGAVIV